MLAEAHNSGRVVSGDNPQIRIMGDVEKCLELVREFGLEHRVSGIYKNYKDKNRREQFHPSNVRVYINL